jgi:hypothetical protein
VTAGAVATGSRFCSARCSAAFCEVRAGGDCEIWQQAGTEIALLTDTGVFGMSMPAQPLDTLEEGIAQRGAAHKEPDTKTNISSKLAATLPRPFLICRGCLSEIMCGSQPLPTLPARLLAVTYVTPCCESRYP